MRRRILDRILERKIVTMLLNNTTMEHRLCKVGKEIGYFHCWEQYSDINVPGSRIFGIIEFDNRVEQVDPSKIRFIDEIHYSLQKYFEALTEKEEDDDK